MQTEHITERDTKTIENIKYFDTSGMSVEVLFLVYLIASLWEHSIAIELIGFYELGFHASHTMMKHMIHTLCFWLEHESLHQRPQGEG